MYILPTQYLQVYEEIKRTSLSHSTCKLMIYVSCLSIDSLCAAKILSTIFKKELIQYQLIPVVGYTDLQHHYMKLDNDVSNVILVGCGGMLDLESFFDVNEEEFLPDESNGSTVDRSGDTLYLLSKMRRRIFIIDGHRPWNLDNIFGSSVIISFDDGYIDSNLEEEKKAYETLSQLSGDSEEENDFSEDTTEEDEVSNEESDEGDSEDSVSRKRSRQEKQLERMRKRRKSEILRSENIIENYYNQGTTVMTSNTAIVYALLSSIGETNINNLWLAIIGTSSLDNQFPEVYDKYQPLYKEEVFRLNPTANGGTDVNEKTADSTTLNIEKDYHLFLLRHWTLYDAFFYSSHVNSKLNLWTQTGKKKLHKLFAKMGVSLDVAQQKWLYMDIGIKKQLPTIFSRYLPMYGLEDIVREGFVRTFGFSGQLSAIECVEALTALLEYDSSLGENGLGVINQGNEKNNEDSVNASIRHRERNWVENFWSSWDALNMNTKSSKYIADGTINHRKHTTGFEALIQGLQQAKEIQQVIFRTGMSLLERRLVKNLRLYRLCILNEGTVPDLSTLCNPLILAKLGTWLLENITELEFMNTEKSISLKPLVVASLDVPSDTFLVITLAPKYPRGIDNTTRAKLTQLNQKSATARLNTFSVAFQQTASSSGAKVRIDSFDSSIIEIRRDDLSPFLEKLTLSGLV